MATCHAHNLRKPEATRPKPYGIRVSLRPDDPFRRLLGPDWSRTHWFESADERDAKLRDMSRKHEYSRPGDRPALVFEKVEKLAERLARDATPR